MRGAASNERCRLPASCAGAAPRVARVSAVSHVTRVPTFCLAARAARVLCVLATLVAVASAARAAEPGEPDLGWIDRAQLEAGEVLVESHRSSRPRTVVVRVAAYVAARPEAIFEVLSACEVAPEYVPNVQSCRSLEKLANGRAELFVQTVKPAFFIPSFEHVFRLDYTPYERIDVSRVSGPIEHMMGSWWLVDEDDHVLLVYELEMDPGMPVPRFFVRATLRRDLPRIIMAVRERAEAATPR